MLIKPSDAKRHWEKAESVLKVVDESLGVNHGVRAQMRSEFYLTIKDKRVVGMLLAESLAPTDRVSRSFIKNKVRVLSDLDTKSKPDLLKSLIGISRIWVHPDYQRSGIASRMGDALRERFRFPFKAEKGALAFSHTTEMGSAFAESYVGKEEFLVYQAAL